MATLFSKKLLPASPVDRPERVATLAVRRRLGDVRKSLARAGKRSNPSERRMHELRVAARRADAALVLFADFLPKKRAARLMKRLARVRHAAGEARDLDVLSERLTSDVTGVAGDELRAELLKQREKTRTPILKMYERLRRGRRFEKSCEKLAKRARRQRGNEQSKRSTFGEWARRKLDALVAEFFAAEPPAEWDQKAWHAFRVRGKALRYAMELAACAFSPAWREELYPLVAELQDRLGALNDLANTRRCIGELICVPDESVDAVAEFMDRQEASLFDAREEFVAWYFDHARHALREGFDRELAHDPLGV